MEDISTANNTTSDNDKTDMVLVTGQAAREGGDASGISFWGILILIMIGSILLLILLFRRRNSVLYG